ncbi:oligosaccharide flippase family protein [Zhongshania guokunii]|uniref:Oligosaccharide flippase family protein n=1 Tax=Zhongshania guokunii TaxID=641783 RepID=A0ABV3UCH8_9GAMM
MLKILLRVCSDFHFTEILKGAFSALTIKIFSAGLAFGLSLLLARLLGASGVGIYYLALSVVVLASVVARMGLSLTLLRFSAAAVAEKNWAELNGVYWKCLYVVVPLSLTVTALLLLVSKLLSQKVFGEPAIERVLNVMAFSILPMSLAVIHAELIRGFKKIASSLFVLGIVLPFTNCLAMWFLIPRLGQVGAAWAYFLATVCASLFAIIVSMKYTSKSRGIGGVFSWRKLLESAVPNYITNLIQQGILLSLPVILLGYYASSQEVGVYSICVRIASLVSFVLVAVNSISGPKISALFKQGNIKQLERVVQQSTALMTVSGLVVVLPILLWPRYVLSMFGEDFTYGSLVLLVLAMGQLINVMFGSVGLLLTMTGHERQQRNSIAISSVILIVTMPISIVEFGVLGAALSTVLSGFIFNACTFYLAQKRLGVTSIGFKFI